MEKDKETFIKKILAKIFFSLHFAHFHLQEHIDWLFEAYKIRQDIDIGRRDDDDHHHINYTQWKSIRVA